MISMIFKWEKVQNRTGYAATGAERSGGKRKRSYIYLGFFVFTVLLGGTWKKLVTVVASFKRDLAGWDQGGKETYFLPYTLFFTIYLLYCFNYMCVSYLNFFFFKESKFSKPESRVSHPSALCEILINVQLSTTLDVDYFYSDRRGAKNSQVAEQFLSFSAVDILSWIILCCGAVLCIVGLAASLVSAHQMSAAPPCPSCDSH